MDKNTLGALVALVFFAAGMLFWPLRWQDGLPLAAFAAAQRYVNVIAKPGSKRNMPAAPKLGYIPGEIGIMEIAHQVETKHMR